MSILAAGAVGEDFDLGRGLLQVVQLVERGLLFAQYFGIRRPRFLKGPDRLLQRGGVFRSDGRRGYGSHCGSGLHHDRLGRLRLRGESRQGRTNQDCQD